MTAICIPFVRQSTTKNVVGLSSVDLVQITIHSDPLHRERPSAPPAVLQVYSAQEYDEPSRTTYGAGVIQGYAVPSIQEGEAARTLEVVDGTVDLPPEKLSSTGGPIELAVVEAPVEVGGIHIPTTDMLIYRQGSGEDPNYSSGQFLISDLSITSIYPFEPVVMRNVAWTYSYRRAP